uniref:Uncharacterized protein n=1 Tax=Arundo donax TaxID=35708 RepID=A0A0A9BP15_ARUDO
MRVRSRRASLIVNPPASPPRVAGSSGQSSPSHFVLSGGLSPSPTSPPRAASSEERRTMAAGA